MALSDVEARALVVSPNLDILVAAAGDHLRPIRADVQRVDLGSLGAVHDADGAPVESLPPRNLAIGAGGHDLGLIGVIRASLEEGVRGELAAAVKGGEVPDDGAAVGARTDALAVVGAQREGVHGTLVLLHGRQHRLRLGSDAPDADEPFDAAGHNLPAAAAPANRGHLLVSVVDGVHQTARLRCKDANLTVGPAGQDAAAVRHEGHALALDVGAGDS